MSKVETKPHYQIQELSMTENNFLFFYPAEETISKKVTFSTGSLAALQQSMKRVKIFVIIMVFALSPLVGSTEDKGFDPIIGLLTVPQVFGGFPCEKFESRSIPVFSTFGSEKPIAVIRVDKMWTFPKEGGCEGLEVRVHRPDNSTIEKLPSKEFEYEKSPAVIVFEKRNDWYRIQMENGSGWVSVTTENTFLPLMELFSSHKPYLTNEWDGRIWQSPNIGAKQVTGAKPGIAVRVLKSNLVDGKLWIAVLLPAEDDCGDIDNSIPPTQGWIPAHSKSGNVTLWFNSRGC